MKSEPQVEFNLPDEDRSIEVYHIGVCCCGNNPVMQKRHNVELGRSEYRVECGAVIQRVGSGFRVNPSYHSEPTPWLKSSSEAVAVWRLAIRLARA